MEKQLETKPYVIFIVSCLGAEAIYMWLTEEEYLGIERLARLSYGRPSWITVVDGQDINGR